MKRRFFLEGKSVQGKWGLLVQGSHSVIPIKLKFDCGEDGERGTQVWLGQDVEGMLDCSSGTASGDYFREVSLWTL
jgi:hypothetical protein